MDINEGKINCYDTIYIVYPDILYSRVIDYHINSSNVGYAIGHGYELCLKLEQDSDVVNYFNVKMNNMVNNGILGRVPDYKFDIFMNNCSFKGCLVKEISINNTDIDVIVTVLSDYCLIDCEPPPEVIAILRNQTIDDILNIT